jgi:hypothetical protein
MSVNKKSASVVDLVRKGGKTVAVPRQTDAKPGNTVEIGGENHTIGQIAGGDIHNHAYATPPRPPKVTVQPSGEVVTEAQKVALIQLRDEWIALHNAIRKQPLSYAAAQKAINNQVQVTSYHLIPATRYDDLVRWIKLQMGRLRNMPSAIVKDDSWHTAKIRAIKARCRNQLGDQYAYKPYLKKTFGAESLTDLSSDQLQRTYTYVMGKRPSEPR